MKLSELENILTEKLGDCINQVEAKQLEKKTTDVRKCEHQWVRVKNENRHRLICRKCGVNKAWHDMND